MAAAATRCAGLAGAIGRHEATANRCVGPQRSFAVTRAPYSCFSPHSNESLLHGLCSGGSRRGVGAQKRGLAWNGPARASHASSTSSSSSAASAPSPLPPAASSPKDNPASRPYARHRPQLPQPASYRLPVALLLGFSLVSWSAFTLHATNRERLSSSVLKNVMDRIKTSPSVAHTMGDDVNLKRELILAGDAWIRGSVRARRRRRREY